MADHRLKQKKHQNYQAIRLTSGKWLWRYMIQDGWEEGECDSREHAIQHCVDGAKIMNGTKLKPSQVCVGHEQAVTRTTIEIIWGPS